MCLTKYFQETKAHIELINEALEVLKDKLPIKNCNELDSLEKFALNVLIFRFSKLQDLLGSKIFRSYLEFSSFDTSEKSNLLQKKIKALSRLERALHKPIDIVVHRDFNREIEQEALKGIIL